MTRMASIKVDSEKMSQLWVLSEISRYLLEAKQELSLEGDAMRLTTSKGTQSLLEVHQVLLQAMEGR